jgi:hypothetical protein
MRIPCMCLCLSWEGVASGATDSAVKTAGADEIMAAATLQVLQYTVPQLQLKWQYMEQALGGGSKDIAACPYYLETSLINVLGE